MWNTLKDAGMQEEIFGYGVQRRCEKCDVFLRKRLGERYVRSALHR